MHDLSGELQSDFSTLFSLYLFSNYRHKDSANGSDYLDILSSEPEGVPEPAYLHEELPSDPQKLNELLQMELARSRPNSSFVRSILRRNNYSISKELRCRAYSILLGVDSNLVKSLADNSWSVNTVNTGIIEDYLHHIYFRFSDNSTQDALSLSLEDAENTMIENTIWVIHGLIINTGTSYHHCIRFSKNSHFLVLSELALLLLARFGINREFTLLFILKMFELDIIDTNRYLKELKIQKKSLIPTTSLNPEFDPILNQTSELSSKVRLPLFSIARGKSTYRVHQLFSHLVAFHLPDLWNHLEKVSDVWWYPLCYPIEEQDDFITVFMFV